MEKITLRQLLNIMSATDKVRLNLCLKDNNEYENVDIVRVGELREGNNLLLSYEVYLFYPTTDIQINETNIVEIVLRKRNS